MICKCNICTQQKLKLKVRLKSKIYNVFLGHIEYIYMETNNPILIWLRQYSD